MKLDYNKRIYIIIACLLAYAAIIWYQTWVTLVRDGSEYRKRVEKLKKETEPIEPVRGFIFADGGEMLAGSLPEYDVALDFYWTTIPEGPKRIKNIPEDTIKKYFGPNGEGSRALANAYTDPTKNKKSADAWGSEILKAYGKREKSGHQVFRALPYLDYKRLRQQPYFNKTRYQNGIIAQERAHRYRPYGERRMASATIGTVYTKDQDSIRRAGQGLRGIELGYNDYLAGTQGLGYGLKVRGKIENVTITPPVDGANVHTTIDIEMQHILDEELGRRILDLNAAAGWAAFVEVKTGKIRAISNLSRNGSVCVEDYNHLFEDLVDPGSTFKTVSYMVMLDDGKITPETIVDTENNSSNAPHPWVYYKHPISDDHPVGVVTANKAIEQSSNIAVAKLAVAAYDNNPQQYLDGLERIGFLNDRELNDSDRAQIKQVGYLKELAFRREFPGAKAARHRQMSGKSWSKLSLAQISYGYETQIPGIYMLQFYNAIANNGKMLRPYIVDYVEKDGKVLYEQEPTVINKKICKDETLKAVRHALECVVNSGTAAGRPRNHPRGYQEAVKSQRVSIAGKTGTAQRRNEATGGFKGAGHNVSFVGYFPADNPQYCGIVVINTNGSGISAAGGGWMAGPVFKHFAEQVYALRGHRTMKDIAPDTIAHEPHVKAKANTVQAISGTMPNVKGMGAADALMMLETAGYTNVKVNGYGKVASVTQQNGNVIINLK
ncbi:MAG: hypothetical protein KBT20_01865 [Bacteroidales bacterium]|nr:hypothetical protein [Candidatus Liminaster caballi]